MNHHFRDQDYLQDVDVKICDLLVATADTSDRGVDGAVREVLHLVQQKTGMDIVFVLHSQRPGRSFASAAEVLWGEGAVRRRMPAPVTSAAGSEPDRCEGAYLHSPVLLQGGEVYGTLCSFSAGADAWSTRRDQDRLRYTASLTSARVRANRRPLALQPVTLKGGWQARPPAVAAPA